MQMTAEEFYRERRYQVIMHFVRALSLRRNITRLIQKTARSFYLLQVTY